MWYCISWGVKNIHLAGQICLHEDIWGIYPSNHCCCTSSSLRFHMRRGNGEKFRGFPASLVVPWVPECFVEVVAGIWAAVNQISSMIIERQGCTTSAWKGHEKTTLDISYRLKNSRHVFGTGVGDGGCKPVRKSSHFLKISAAVDLHEESRIIAQGIWTNSIARSFFLLLVYI